MVDLEGLPPVQVAPRLDRLRGVLGDAGVEVLLVSSMTNIRYLTGFTGSAGVLVVAPDRAALITDGRYGEQAAAQLGAAGVNAAVEVAGAAKQQEAVTAAVPHGERLALEAAHVSWARQRVLDEQWFPGRQLVATTGLVEGLRRVKDPGELARVAAAAAVADSAFGAVAPMLEQRPTEAEFGLALDTEMRRRGAAEPSFETIVASGPNAAMPHHRPHDRRVGPGETVVVDFGATVDGYRSDMTRTVWVGDLEHPELRRAVAVVAESQAAGVAAVGAGRECAAVDGACREVIDAAGWKERFVHGTGHGVGLEIHEAPSVAATSTDTLAAGHVVTVEPGVYLPGLGGVRIEDTVAVSDAGCDTLTRYPKQLVA